MEQSAQKFEIEVALRLSDGMEEPKDALLEFTEKLLLLSGGFTLGEPVKGADRMADGKCKNGGSARYLISLPSRCEEELRRIVRELDEALGRESPNAANACSVIESLPARCKGSN